MKRGLSPYCAAFSRRAEGIGSYLRFPNRTSLQFAAQYFNAGNAALAVLSGVLLVLSFPIISFSSLAWIAFVPLLVALHGQSMKNGFALGAITGMVFFTGTIYWITNAVHDYGNIQLIPAWSLTFFLSCYLALYPALFSALVIFIQKQYKQDLVILVAVPAVWTALELLRTHFLSGFPWALIGYSQHNALPLIQIADVTGVYGISFLVLFVNSGAAQLILHQKMTGFMTAMITVVLAMIYGTMRLDQTEPSGPGFTVSVVQGNINQDKKWNPAYQKETVSRYTKLTTEALKERPDLVIWPETSTPFYFNGTDPDEQNLTKGLIQFVQENQVPLLFGSATYQSRGPQNFILRNTAFLLSDTGHVAARYDKIHLVPFGEYVPLKNLLFFVDKLVHASGDFEAGKEHTLIRMQTRAERQEIALSTVICYEIIFPNLVRKFVARGTGVLTTITNDAWFGRTAAPYQHFSMAVFRAVENRVPIARAANTGVSGFIDAQGRILASTDIFTAVHLTQTLAPGSTRTFYTRYGNVFSFLCIIYSLAVIIPGLRGRNGY